MIFHIYWFNDKDKPYFTGEEEEGTSREETWADSSLWCCSIHETCCRHWPISERIWSYRYDAKRWVSFCYYNLIYAQCLKTFFLLFGKLSINTFFSSIRSFEASFWKTNHNNKGCSRYIISKEKCTQQSFKKGSHWKVNVILFNQCSDLILLILIENIFDEMCKIICFIFRSTSRTNNMAEVQNEIERIFELAKVMYFRH